MKFSTRTLYGLKAILVLASRFGEGSLSVSQIAKKESISVAYLEQILNALKKKGVVKSVRGPQGGYVLTKKPSDISLKTLFYVLADEVQEETNGHAGAADGDEICAANQIFWKRLRHSIDEGLGGVTLKDLLDEARKARKGRGASYAFNI